MKCLTKQEYKSIEDELKTTTNILRYMELKELIMESSIDCSPYHLVTETEKKIFIEIKQLLIRHTLSQMTNTDKNNLFNEFGKIYLNECNKTDRLEEIRKSVMNKEVN